MLTQLLEKFGPCLSTRLAERLMETHNLTAAAARQRVSRGEPDVRRLSNLPFAKRANFIYLKGQFASNKYWSGLYSAILAENGPYARALGAVQARLAVPVDDFDAACGAPVSQKKKVIASVVLERMIAADVLVTEFLPGLGSCVLTKKDYEQYSHDLDDLARKVRSRLVAEKILLDCLKEWLRRLALVSFHAVRTRGDKTARVGTFKWDLTAPSYLTPLILRDKGLVSKSGWVVCDVMLIENIRLEHVQAFLYKAASINALPKIGRTLFFCIAHSYEKDAFRALREAGVVPATLATLFGKEVAEGFVDLVETLSEASRGIVEPEKFDILFAKLGKLEGALGNMRGAFFELLVAEVVRKTSPGILKINKVCKTEIGIAEVDIYNLNDGISARMIECKGVAPGSLVDEEEIDLWLTVRILRLRKHLNEIGWNGPLPIFELWTSGSISQFSKERIERTKSANSNKFSIRVVDAEKLGLIVRDVNDQSLLSTFEQHFLP